MGRNLQKPLRRGSIVSAHNQSVLGRQQDQGAPRGYAGGDRARGGQPRPDASATEEISLMDSCGSRLWTCSDEPLGWLLVLGTQLVIQSGQPFPPTSTFRPLVHLRLPQPCLSSSDLLLWSAQVGPVVGHRISDRLGGFPEG